MVIKVVVHPISIGTVHILVLAGAEGVIRPGAHVLRRVVRLIFRQS